MVAENQAHTLQSEPERYITPEKSVEVCFQRNAERVRQLALMLDELLHTEAQAVLHQVGIIWIWNMRMDHTEHEHMTMPQVINKLHLTSRSAVIDVKQP